MAEEEANFLSRWARRKQAVREAEAAPEDAAPDTAAETASVPASAEADRPLTEEEVAALPDPDTLGPGDDFKAFLRKGVPEELKRRALRRLWRSNPVFGVLDGLNDYDLNYTDAATVVANLKTVFQVGKGVVLPEDEADATANGTASGQQPTSAPPERPDARAEPDAADCESEGRLGREAPPATDKPDSSDVNKLPEVAKSDGDTRLPSFGPQREPAAGSATERPRGRAAQRRWGGFAPVSESDGSDADG